MRGKKRVEKDGIEKEEKVFGPLSLMRDNLRSKDRYVKNKKTKAEIKKEDTTETSKK